MSGYRDGLRAWHARGSSVRYNSSGGPTDGGLSVASWLTEPRLMIAPHAEVRAGVARGMR
jgi:hypothetical protein